MYELFYIETINHTHVDHFVYEHTLYIETFSYLVLRLPQMHIKDPIY